MMILLACETLIKGLRHSSMETIHSYACSSSQSSSNLLGYVFVVCAYPNPPDFSFILIFLFLFSFVEFYFEVFPGFVNY